MLGRLEGADGRLKKRIAGGKDLLQIIHPDHQMGRCAGRIVAQLRRGAVTLPAEDGHLEPENTLLRNLDQPPLFIPGIRDQDQVVRTELIGMVGHQILQAVAARGLLVGDHGQAEIAGGLDPGRFKSLDRQQAGDQPLVVVLSPAAEKLIPNHFQFKRPALPLFQIPRWHHIKMRKDPDRAAALLAVELAQHIRTITAGDARIRSVQLAQLIESRFFQPAAHKIGLFLLPLPATLGRQGGYGHQTALQGDDLFPAAVDHSGQLFHLLRFGHKASRYFLIFRSASSCASSGRSYRTCNPGVGPQILSSRRAFVEEEIEKRESG